MLSKTGAVALGLLCLMATASFLYAAGSPPGQQAPTIGELEAFATTAAGPAATDVGAAIARAEAKVKEDKGYIARDILDGLVDLKLTDEQIGKVADLRKQADRIIQRKEKEAAKRLGYQPSPEQAERASDVMMEYTQKVRVDQEMKKVQAAELVDEASQLLYHERNAEKAYELANKALLLDPENMRADDLKTEAGMELGKPAEEVKSAVASGLKLPRVRQEAALQALGNTLERARRLYGEGNYEDALDQLRRARLTVESLAVSMDMEGYRRQVESMWQTVQAGYAQAQRDLAGQQRVEAERQVRERIAGITDVERKRQARLVEEIRGLIKDKNFDEAERTLDDLEVSDPADELVPKLREELSDAQHEHEVAKLNAATERGNLSDFVREVDRELVPERTFDYPDKGFWKKVVEKREATLYPSEELMKAMAPEDQAVTSHLQDKVTLSFRDTPLVDVVDFLEQTTDVNYVVFRNDIPADGAPVSLTMETTLKNALDQICDLTKMAWKVDGGLIKIGLPETLRTYEWRVYFVHDLLLSIEEKYSSIAGGGGGGGRGGGGGLGGGGGGLQTTGGGGGGGGFGGFQFGSQNSDVSAQYQGGGNRRGGGGQGGGGQGNASYITDRGQNLVMLLKYTCSPETWMDLTSTGIIDVGGISGGGGGQGGGGVGGGGAGGGLPGEFGGRTGAGRAGAGGFGPTGAGFGPPAGFAPTAPGFGPAARMPGAAGAGAAAAVPQGAAFFRPDEPGVLIIIQTPEVHECIEALLKNMRAAKKIQVQVDVRFLEVSSAFLREVGFEWQNFDLHPLEGFDQFQLYSLGPAPFIGTPLGAPNDSTPGLTLNMGSYDQGAARLDGVFRLGHSRDAVRTLSAPRIVLANGQMGYITVSTSRSYVSTYDVQDSQLIPQTDTVDDGIDLSVRPIVSYDRRYVFLELQPTVLIADISRTLTFQTGGAAIATAGVIQTVQPITNIITLPSETQQTLETTVGVPDRGVLIVGGLTKTKRNQAEGGLPFFDKIPIIKRLFSAETETVDRDTLFVIVKPTIIILSEEEERMR